MFFNQLDQLNQTQKSKPIITNFNKTMSKFVLNPNNNRENKVSFIETKIQDLDLKIHNEL